MENFDFKKIRGWLPRDFWMQLMVFAELKYDSRLLELATAEATHTISFYEGEDLRRPIKNLPQYQQDLLKTLWETSGTQAKVNKIKALIEIQKEESRKFWDKQADDLCKMI